MSGHLWAFSNTMLKLIYGRCQARFGDCRCRRRKGHPMLLNGHLWWNWDHTSWREW